jgi:hypothetical protein
MEDGFVVCCCCCCGGGGGGVVVFDVAVDGAVLLFVVVVFRLQGRRDRRSVRWFILLGLPAIVASRRFNACVLLLYIVSHIFLCRSSLSLFLLILSDLFPLVG